MSRYFFTRQAERDLVAIADYTVEHWGKTKAREYLQAIYDAAQRLAENPALGHRRKEIPLPYLVYVIGSHTLVYCVRKKGVYIAYVPHSAMDLEARLQAALIK